MTPTTRLWLGPSLAVVLVSLPLLGFAQQEKTPAVPHESSAAQQLRANLELDVCLANPALQKRLADLERTIRQLQISQQCAAVEKDARDRLKPEKSTVFNCYTQTFDAPAPTKGSP